MRGAEKYTSGTVPRPSGTARRTHTREARRRKRSRRDTAHGTTRRTGCNSWHRFDGVDEESQRYGKIRPLSMPAMIQTASAAQSAKVAYSTAFERCSRKASQSANGTIK